MCSSLDDFAFRVGDGIHQAHGAAAEDHGAAAEGVVRAVLHVGLVLGQDVQLVQDGPCLQ